MEAAGFCFLVGPECALGRHFRQLGDGDIPRDIISRDIITVWLAA